MREAWTPTSSSGRGWRLAPSSPSTEGLEVDSGKPEEDPRESQRQTGRRFNAAVGTDFMTVRVDLDP
jgi:hypothetical protein